MAVLARTLQPEQVRLGYAQNGRVFASWDLAEEYGVNDADGSRPHFVRWLRENMPEVAAGWRKADDGFYAYWGKTPYGTPGS